jgi:pimeloyl-ACP methyl ester carboxylesterase
LGILILLTAIPVIMRDRIHILALFFLLPPLTLIGCSSADHLRDRREAADMMAREQGWQSLSIDVGMFVLTGYAKPGEGHDLVIYIEGDGRAWLNRRSPSGDPTPRDPIALRLALKDPAPKVIYLGRPCQYTTRATAKDCHPRYWKASRFSPGVVDAMDEALTRAKQRLGGNRLHLIGYSGGGGLAVLLAARRDDVITVITVAGNLDHDTWTRHHGVTPLSDSLNPIDLAGSLRDRPQIHFTGLKDKVVPPQVAESFLNRMGKPTKARLVRMPRFGHRCCWVDAWPRLLYKYRPLEYLQIGDVLK